MANFNQYRTTPLQQQRMDEIMTGLKKGRTDKEYRADLARKRAPLSPYQHAEKRIRDNNEGDKDYQYDEMRSYYDSDAGKKEMSNFYSENSKWFNPDGKRTNYRLTPEDIAINNKNDAKAKQRAEAAALRNAPAPQTPAPQAPVAPPPQLSQVQQNMQQPVVKGPVRDFSSKGPAQSGWQAGGWGKPAPQIAPQTAPQGLMAQQQPIRN